ncbi:prostaglandin reductase 1 [Agrilus planipennis]|uniref:Prostaglandin reductase 1 n=1 Tax=Agrilus planipennis TaxID=224129 RepID=A0A1W4WHR3_AGRPL|nr:prostaglandin reductase 1 [Agrilus planipennis]
MVLARKYILSRHFKGLPKADDLKLVEEELPPLKEGQFLSEAVYFSVDPFLRAYNPLQPLGSTMLGNQVAKIIKSKNSKYPEGKYIYGAYGWRTHTIGPKQLEEDALGYKEQEYLLPDFGNLPLSLGLGMLGMPGNTAYFGFLELCKPKEGETVVVTAAAGAIGSHVGQIAKIKKCRVIGIAGSDEKGKWLTEELGFDSFINYKKPGLLENLKAAAPNGIDCYFDNVGGEISSIVISQMNSFGRIAVCGAITSYNSDITNMPKATMIQGFLILKQLKLEGYYVFRWIDRWMEGINQNLQWIKEGKLKYRETVTEGFENLLPALIDLLNGGNVGKAIVKA